MGLASSSKGVEKYRLSGSARAVHCVAAIAAAANLLLVLFLLNGRIAADTILVVQGKLAPFEWVGKSCCHLSLPPPVPHPPQYTHVVYMTPFPSSGAASVCVT